MELLAMMELLIQLYVQMMELLVQLLAPSCAKRNKNFIAYLTSWHNSIFGYKLRTMEVENP